MPTSAEKQIGDLLPIWANAKRFCDDHLLWRSSFYETSTSSMSRVLHIMNYGDEVSHAFWLQNTDFLICWTMWLAPTRTRTDLPYLAFISLHLATYQFTPVCLFAINSVQAFLIDSGALYVVGPSTNRSGSLNQSSWPRHWNQLCLQHIRIWERKKRREHDDHGCDFVMVDSFYVVPYLSPDFVSLVLLPSFSLPSFLPLRLCEKRSTSNMSDHVNGSTFFRPHFSIYIYLCIYIYIHTYIHTYIHISQK